MEKVKLFMLFAFLGIGIAVFFNLTIAKFLTKFYDIGKKNDNKKTKKKGEK